MGELQSALDAFAAEDLHGLGDGAVLEHAIQAARGVSNAAART